MRRFATAVARRLRDDAAFTLVELLVVITLLLVVMAATMGFLIVAMHTQQRDQQWSLAIQDAQAGLSRMMREIRQATNVNDGDDTFIDFNVTENGTALHVAYYCNVAQPNPPAGFPSGTFSECVRYQAAQGASLPSTSAPMILRVKNSSVFSYNQWPNPTYVTAQVKTPSTGELAAGLTKGVGHNIWLSSGGYLRNTAVVAGS